MPQADKVSFDTKDNLAYVSGQLNFQNVMAVYQDSLLYIRQNDTLVFDLASLTTNDSSGIALLFEWIRLARKANKKVSIKNLTQDLITLLEASDLDNLVGRYLAR